MTIMILMECTNRACDSYGLIIDIPGQESHGRIWADDCLDEVCEDCGKDLENADD